MASAEENSSMRMSRLKPPTQIFSPEYALAEISESQSNARPKPVSMLPTFPMKHKLPNSYEPEPKRQTLAERAGEPNPKSIATATSLKRTVVKGTTLAAAQKSFNRNPSSTSSSASSRTTSANPRNTSNGHHGSMSNSVSQYARPTTSHGNRPGGFSQSTVSRTGSFQSKSRPATAMDHHLEDEAHEAGRRKGTDSLDSISSSNASLQDCSRMKNTKIRRPALHASISYHRSSSDNRTLSISSAMTRLTLEGKTEHRKFPERQASSGSKKSAFRTNNLFTQSYTSLRNSRNSTDQYTMVPYRDSSDSLVALNTSSQIPVPSKVEALKQTPTTPCKIPKQSPQKSSFLTKDSNVPGFVAWDVEGRIEQMESIYSKFEETIKSTTLDRNGLEEAITAYKARVFDLESQKAQLDSSKQALQHDLDTMRQKADVLQQRMMTASTNLDEKMRAHHAEIDELKRECRNDIDKIRREKEDEINKILKLHREDMRNLERQGTTELDEKVKELERRYDAKLEDERNRRLREVQELESKITSETLNGGLEVQRKEQELQLLRSDIESVKGDFDREQTLRANAQAEIASMKEMLKKTGVESTSTIQSLEQTVASLRARIHFLESGSKAQSDSFAEMESRLQDAVRSAEVSKQKLIKEETLRRILFNQVQELKGNIRVMCRVRPVFNSDGNDVAKIAFPDTDKESKELLITGREEKSSLGTITRKNHSFAFDRVFGPESQNQEVFQEISQLVQSALDGYNVCIFCYGQTGSGKTHTMSSEDGMIPRATHQIYETATNLKEKGWEYNMEGSFVEVYNEEIHDLLGNSKDGEKKKHEIRHDESKKQTMITGLKTVALDSPNTVEIMLKQAANNRSVAATKSNERSSRSHSVFILKLVGRNTTTGETSEGTLNLVDLAGSERLKQSGAEGDRMKETQNINKSLSCLGDVIGALGQGKEGAHIPYRNSKLTYLLQYSLGGNSKTLMFVMASPLEAHLSETLTSLKFATKVHNTHIGTAKKSVKSA